MTSPRWNIYTKAAVLAGLLIIAVTLLVIFRGMIAPTIVAFLLTFILSYPVNWVQQRTGWARAANVLLIYATVLLLLALAPALIVPRLLALSSSLSETITDLLNQLRTVDSPELVLGPFRFSLNTLLEDSGTIVRSFLSAATAAPIVRGLTTGVVSVVYTLVLSYWLLLDLNKLQRFLLELVPLDYQEEVRRLLTDLGDIWQAFLRGQLTLGLVVGIVTYIPLLIVGMPNAGGLALLAAVMELLPSIGPAISGTIGTVSALFQGSDWLPIGNFAFAILVGIIYAIIGQIEGVYFIPRFVGRRVNLHPAVTFVGIINGALAFGVLGILLAAPIIASTRSILTYIIHKLNDQQPFEPLRTAQSAIRIPGLIAGRKIEGIIFDLEGVVTQLDLRALEWVDHRFRWMDALVSPQQRKMLLRRLLIMLEGFVSFLASQLWRLKLHNDLKRLQPALDWLRGFPAAKEYQLQAGIDEVLQILGARYRLVLISSRMRSELQPFLDSAPLDTTLRHQIITRDDVRNALPHSDPLALAAEQLGVPHDQILMVSDTDVNLRAARAMEMATAGILSGLGIVGSLSESDVIVETPKQLLEWL